MKLKLIILSILFSCSLGYAQQVDTSWTRSLSGSMFSALMPDQSLGDLPFLGAQLGPLYPNTASDNTGLEIRAFLPLDLTLRIVDLGDSLVHKHDVRILPGQSRIDLPLYHLAPGAYQLEIMYENMVLGYRSLLVER